MTPTTGELLQQGLIITVLGITLVFAGLGLLWGLMELLMRVMPAEAPAGPDNEEEAASAAETAGPLVDAKPDLTAERAQVAAIAASMVLAHALPGQVMTLPSALPLSEDGHGEPWMNTYRGRSLHPWQPPRVSEK